MFDSIGDSARYNTFPFLLTTQPIAFSSACIVSPRLRILKYSAVNPAAVYSPMTKQFEDRTIQAVPL